MKEFKKHNYKKMVNTNENIKEKGRLKCKKNKSKK